MLIKLARLALALPILALAACNLQAPNPSDTPRPPVKTQSGPSDKSKRLKAFYASREARLIAQGKLREDFAPKDAPFGPDELIRNFRRTALYDEYRTDAPGLVAEETLSQLRRWKKPLQIAVKFGDSVSPTQRRSDLKEVRSFARRLGKLTGLKVNFTNLANANFVVMFLDADESKTVPSQVAPLAPWMGLEVVNGIESLPDEIYCIAYGRTSDAPPFGYIGSVVVVKAENPPRLRKSCIQEEMSQALGLANDGPDIRPSIFNDDEEFAYLTAHDEFLLKMLYDPRLADGMTPATQAPILRQVAQDAMKKSLIF